MAKSNNVVSESDVLFLKDYFSKTVSVESMCARHGLTRNEISIRYGNLVRQYGIPMVRSATASEGDNGKGKTILVHLPAHVYAALDKLVSSSSERNKVICAAIDSHVAKSVVGGAQ